MISVDTAALSARLRTIESVAVMTRVSSTNALARRIVNDCLETGLHAPSAILIAGEQYAGRGRSSRTWVSPPGAGIYATTIHTRPADELAMVPLAVANMIATLLRRQYGIDARIKWPNDILVDGRKIAGILIEARTQDANSILIIGTGINVARADRPTVVNATSIAELIGYQVDLSEAVVGFVEELDEVLSSPLKRKDVLGDWRALALHREGDTVQCLIGSRNVSGAWAGIDDWGRAVLRKDGEDTVISAGELYMVDDSLDDL
jgi:BirA family biotin operon repressor/biotin-[acetyl-CoA-carboxylase] ligase